MKIIYYKVVEVWCKYPFNDTIDYRYCIFSESKRNFFKRKFDFIMDSQTTIAEKEKFVCEQLKIKRVKIEKCGITTL